MPTRPSRAALLPAILAVALGLLPLVGACRSIPPAGAVLEAVSASGAPASTTPSASRATVEAGKSPTAAPPSAPAPPASAPASAPPASAPPASAERASAAPPASAPPAQAPPGSAPPGAAPSPPGAVGPRPTGEPFTEFTRIERALQSALDDERVAADMPGISATIILPHGRSWTGVSGMADVAARRPVTPDTAFAIASISKTFLAATVLDLAAERRLGLADRVADHLPDLRLDPEITIRMLLDHTSGLHDYFLSPKIDRALQRRPSLAWTPERALGYVDKPYFDPGTDWHYSNTNYLLLGVLVERITGRPLAAEIRQRFLDPLGLDSAWYQAVEDPRAPRAHGYRLVPTERSVRPVDLTDGSGVMPFRSVVTAAAGAGSLAATSADVARWARALYGGEAIDAASLALMLGGVDAVASYRPRVPYGLGVQAIDIDGRRTLGHSGRFLGFRAIMRWLPEEGVSIAVLSNQSRTELGPIVARLLRIVLPGPKPATGPRPV